MSPVFIDDGDEWLFFGLDVFIYNLVGNIWKHTDGLSDFINKKGFLLEVLWPGIWADSRRRLDQTLWDLIRGTFMDEAPKSGI